MLSSGQINGHYITISNTAWHYYVYTSLSLKAANHLSTWQFSESPSGCEATDFNFMLGHLLNRAKGKMRLRIIIGTKAALDP